MAASASPLESLVRNLAMRAPLAEEDRRALLAVPYAMRTLEAASYIVREGDPPQYCGILVSGYAFRQKLTGEGARQIVAIHIPGEALDFQNILLDEADHSVQMLTRGDVALIHRVHLQALIDSRPAIAHAVLVATLIEASIFREWVLNVGRRNSRQRLAHVLCEFAIRLDAAGLAENRDYELPMTQEQLADTLGLTPVHVNRTLKALEAEGLIKRSKRNVSFPDWERMREVADFNQRYLHLAPQEAAGGGVAAAAKFPGRD